MGKGRLLYFLLWISKLCAIFKVWLFDYHPARVLCVFWRQVFVGSKYFLWPCHFLTVSLEKQIFFFYTDFVVCVLRNLCLATPKLQEYLWGCKIFSSFLFFPDNFLAIAFTFRFVVQFELIIVGGVSCGVVVLSFPSPIVTQLVQHRFFLPRCSFHSG